MTALPCWHPEGTLIARSRTIHPTDRTIHDRGFSPRSESPRPMSTALPPDTPTSGSRIRVKALDGERSVTVDYVEPTPQFNDLDAVRIHATDGFVYTHAELVQW